MNFIFLFLIVQFLQVNWIENQQIFAKQTTNLLDRLLLNYNKYSRPDANTEPTKVHISLEIKDIVHQKDMTLVLQCILNQWWLDSRLSYWKYFVEAKNRTYLPFDPLELTHKLSSINLPNQQFGNQLWLPDTFFLNAEPIAKRPHSNRQLIRLHLDGTVLLSTRIMFKFKCQLGSTTIRRFPHDAQRCSLHLASFSYMDKEIAYRWIQKSPCVLSPKFSISQLDLTKVSCANKTRRLSELWPNSRTYRSTISVDLYFKRNTSLYMLEVYLPSVFLVITSFFAFFINREATNVRILIGSMTSLSMIILSIENRLLVKFVPYLTAIDYFVMISFIFVFASILQFIFVHQHTKLAYGDMVDTLSNWLPVDRIAKLVYASLQPKEQTLIRPSPNPLSLDKDDQLAAVVRLSNEPMIYDLPVTDNLKDDQTVLMNNLLLSNQPFSSLSLRRTPATTDFIGAAHLIATPNYSTFPRANHSSNLFAAESSSHLNDSSLISSLISSNNGTATRRTLGRQLASIPEETFDRFCPLQTGQRNCQSISLQLTDNLKLLRQQQEQQLEEQQNYQLNQLRNVVSELERESDGVSAAEIRKRNCATRLPNTMNNRQSVTNSLTNRLSSRINEKLNALSTKNILGRIWYEFLGSIVKANRDQSTSQLELDSINQLNGISEIDQALIH